MKFIEKHTKLLAIALCVATSGTVLSTVQAYENKPGWHGEGKDRYYILETNRQQATGLVTIDHQLYYFDNEGDLQFGWQHVGDDTYYFQEDGTAATGKSVVSGSLYNFQATGKLVQGWDQAKTHYYDEKGFLVTDAWIEDNGAKYYLNDEGQALTGWQDLEGSRYYFTETGQLVTGQYNIDGTLYTFADDGVFKTGWKEESGSTVYYQPTGQKAVGAVEVDGKKYLFDDNGGLVKNTSDYQGYITNDAGEITSTVAEEQAKQQAAEEAKRQEEARKAEQARQAQEALAQQQAAARAQQQTRAASSTPAYSPAPAAQPSASGATNAIAAAALAQVGQNQDCTMLATRALQAVGINFHGWPEEYARLGSWTGSPVPGDLVIYSGHIAVYIGNGQAVHGGWYGYTTQVFSVNVPNALIGYIHVR